MKRFWTGIIKPIVEALGPSIMIEIGVDKGENTRNILEYCSKNKCKLISIDPFPDNCINELKYEYENEFTLIRDLSLNVLNNIENAQVFFIDGDHNWYTVYNELMVIQNKSKEFFPLIFLHDVEWPYARRDLYYNPDDIPPEYTNEYAQKGIDLHSDQLMEKYGVNSSLDNALACGTPKNGVLTAVEDFLSQANFDLKFFKIPGFHGLGIIYDENVYRENNDFKMSIDGVMASMGHINDYIRKLSYAHYDTLNQNALLEGKNFSNEKLNWELSNQINILNDNEQFLKQNIANISDELLEKDKEITYLKSNINSIGNELTEKNREIKELESSINLLANSRKNEIYKNFQTLFSGYLTNKSFPKKSKSAKLSSIPYLYIFLKSKGNIKNAWVNFKGYKAIKSLNLFDESYYLNKYRNILISGINPLLHYMYYGYKEEKFPSAIFDGKYYLDVYGDVKKSGMNPLVHYSLYGINEGKKTNDIKVSVIVTSYNHEKYIRECIDSILMQKGVDFELIIGDDFSQDNTRKILEEYQKQYPEIIKLLPLTENLGVTKNLKRCLKEATGDYIAICEGDDYWTDHYKLQKQVNFLEEKQDCAICFNSVLVFYEDKEESHIFQKKIGLSKEIFTTRELILDNFIGNFSCCMYRTNAVKKLPDGLYDFFTVDWMFNIICSEYGKIGFLNEPMSAYRVHNSGLWSSKDSDYKRKEILKNIDIYNEFLSFRYDFEFQKFKEMLSADSRPRKSGFQDIIIFDDVFPHPLSAFRFQEYNSYLEHFNKMKIYSTGTALSSLKEKRSLGAVIEDYEEEFPQFEGKVEKYSSEIILQSKVIYTIFLNNIYSYIDTIEKYKIPFMFTLYPGGGFYLNDEISDKKLKKVFSSPYFRKVIVTQKVTYDYLIDNNFCKANQIEHIFGGVAPLNLLEKEYGNKKYFSRDKSVLDICFVAQKYSEKGVDKGYDVFIDVAHELAKKYNNIRFHVVGGFDENVIDITQIKDRIHFYGLQLSDWFDEFYRDKDIILSPNIPFELMDGAFDGFPTGCCTDAGLHNVSIFCTDELKLNTKKYKDEEEIVIIPHDAQKIIEIIEKYYHNPEKLQEIAEAGCLKIKELYNYENQILPRIKILEEIMKDQ